MKCNKCVTELPEGAKFCSNCGNKTETKQQEIVVNVENTATKTNDPVVETQKRETIVDKAKEKGISFWKQRSRLGKLATISLALFSLFAFIALVSGKVGAVIVSLLAIGLTVVGILMKRQIIKVKKTWLPLLSIILSFVLVLPYFSFFCLDESGREKYNWNEVVLADILPQPVSPYGEIITNSEDYLSMDITETTQDQYKDYIAACEAKGFTIDKESSDSNFSAFNETGYKLSLSYYDYSSEMHINVDSAMEMETITWPETEMAKLLPVPTSTTGKIQSNDEDGFTVYIGGTSIEDYNAYVKYCEEKGFTVDAQKDDKHYTAKNAESYKLTVNYEGNNVVYISITEPEFKINIEVECVENWVFSKYDVDVSIDDMFEGTITHGNTETFETVLKRGNHTISFESADDDTLDGKVEMNVSKDETIKLKISCSSSGVDVEVVSGTTAEDAEKAKNMAGAPDVWTNLLEKHYEEVKKQFEDAGFTNVTCVAHEIDYDENNVFEGSVVNIAIGEDGDICTFEKGEQWEKDIKIRIDYRVKPAKEETTTPPSNETETPSQFQDNDDNSGGKAGVSVPDEEESEGDLVWVPTNGGTKYHSRAGCSNMKDPKQVSKETAESNGYTPCKRCH